MANVSRYGNSKKESKANPRDLKHRNKNEDDLWGNHQETGNCWRKNQWAWRYINKHFLNKNMKIKNDKNRISKGCGTTTKDVTYM